TAALLQRQRGFTKPREDSIHRVRNRAHDEAIEQRDRTIRAGTGENASGGKEFVARQRSGELQRSLALVVRGFRAGGGERHARPGGGDVAVHGRAVRLLQPVLHVPDLARNIAHSASVEPLCERLKEITLQPAKVNECSLSVLNQKNQESPLEARIWRPSARSFMVPVSMRSSSAAMNSARFSPAGIGGRNSTTILPGFLMKPVQNRPESSATGMQGTPSCA